MTPRKRMRAFLAGERVDRIPNGLGGTETAGIHVLAYERLKRILKVNDTQNRMYTFMTNSIVEPSVLEAMDGDLIILGSKLCSVPLWGKVAVDQWKPQGFRGVAIQIPVLWDFRTAPDGTVWWENINWKCPPEGIYFDPLPVDPMLSLDKEPTPDEYNPPHDIPDERLRALEESAKWLYENTDYCIVCGESITDLQLKPGGVQAWWMRLSSEPDIAHEFLYKACEAGISQIRLLEQAIGRYADIMAIADDIGDSRGITIGPDLWREIYKPHYVRLFTEWHKITDMKILLHSCGSVYDILEDLIECGLDILNPVQISSSKMDPAGLKSDFGDRLTFFGGAFDAIQTPPSSSPEQVYASVKRNIETLSDGGGYIFAGVHNIPGDTPSSHIEAILKAYMDCRYNESLLE